MPYSSLPTTNGGSDSSSDSVESVDYEAGSAIDDAAEGKAIIAFEGTTAKVTGTGATSSGSIVTIAAAGSYEICGTIADGQIVVEAGSDAVVRLVLNGADISSSKSSPIYIANAGKTFIALETGTRNRVSDAASPVFVDANEREPDAAIFSADDLSIGGEGYLLVEGNYSTGIHGKDALSITGGEIEISSVGDGIKGRDYVAIKAGTITIISGDDGICANNDEDSAKGFVLIEGGIFAIDAAGDGIKAETSLRISGGDIAIAASDDALHAATSLTISSGEIQIRACVEGIESRKIDISGGSIIVNSSDDGVNVMADSASASGEAVASGSLTISGGRLAIYSAQGDGLDSNGSILLSGGTVIVHGPVSAPEVGVDCNGGFVVTGGFFIAVANYNNMTESLASTSTQCSFLEAFASTKSAGTIYHLQDSGGAEILSFKPAKSYQCVLFSSPALVKGSTYTSFTGGSSSGIAVDGQYSGGAYAAGTQSQSFTLSSVTTKVGAGAVASGGGAAGPGGAAQPGATGPGR